MVDRRLFLRASSISLGLMIGMVLHAQLAYADDDASVPEDAEAAATDAGAASPESADASVPEDAQTSSTSQDAATAPPEESRTTPARFEWVAPRVDVLGIAPRSRLRHPGSASVITLEEIRQL